MRAGHPPVFAHFYIWYQVTSWNRAKIDSPLIGKYSTDQEAVMAEQVADAKAAGIDGFIVSWKSTEVLDRRLAMLVDVARRNGFKLAITYEAQDFNRRPLPIRQVLADLTGFADTYRSSPVFAVLGDKPVVVLSGSWNYSADDLRVLSAALSPRIRLLATEKNVGGYGRVAQMFDGDLYYWSSADPMQTPRYRKKLLAMGNAVRAHCGIWIAPVAPGFDAKALGGRMVVGRRAGKTLQASWEAAVATLPDAIGIISWNEFSENTYVEPSQRYGRQSLDTLRALVHAPDPPRKELDSSEPAGASSPVRSLTAVSAVGLLLVAVAIVAMRRRRHPPSSNPPASRAAGRGQS